VANRRVETSVVSSFLEQIIIIFYLNREISNLKWHTEDTILIDSMSMKNSPMAQDSQSVKMAEILISITILMEDGLTNKEIIMDLMASQPNLLNRVLSFGIEFVQNVNIHFLKLDQ